MDYTNQNLVHEILTTLEARHETFALAESCSVGLIASTFSHYSGLSKSFQGSVVSYSNSSKVKLLEVNDKDLESHGAVSSQIALQMAKGAKKVMNADWALSVTGTAGPEGGTKDKPVGTVFFAVAGTDFEEYRKQNFSGERTSVQQQSVDYGLRFFLQILKETKCK